MPRLIEMHVAVPASNVSKQPASKALRSSDTRHEKKTRGTVSHGVVGNIGRLHGRMLKGCLERCMIGKDVQEGTTFFARQR